MKGLKQKLRAKLRGKKGETIGEALVSVLIASVAMVLLASMIASATSIIQRSRNTVNSYYEGNNTLAAQSGSGAAGTVTVAVSGGTETSGTENVKFYVNDKDATVVAYALE